MPEALLTSADAEQFFKQSPAICRLVDIPPIAELGSCGIVDLVIESLTTPVFHAVFDPCHDENRNEGKHCDFRRACAEDWEHLKDDEAEKVDVGDWGCQ